LRERDFQSPAKKSFRDMWKDGINWKIRKWQHEV
jgi:hypothetical protein